MTGVMPEARARKGPEGLTVLSGYGQWRARTGAIIQESARVLVVYYHPAADANAKIGVVRAAYKARFGQQSVIRADGLSCVSL